VMRGVVIVVVVIVGGVIVAVAVAVGVAVAIVVSIIGVGVMVVGVVVVCALVSVPALFKFTAVVLLVRCALFGASLVAPCSALFAVRRSKLFDGV